MTITLSDLILKTAIELGVVRQGVATGGATNTLIDTNLLTTIDDDYYNQGTLIITKDAGGAVDITGVYETISDFDGATGTITLQSGLATAVTADDKYAAVAPRYKPYEIIQQLNNSLYLDGYIPVYDNTSITTAAQQREYTLPAAAVRDLRQVWLQTNENDSDRNIPRMIYNWTIQQATAGNDATLILDEDYQSGLAVYLVYGDQHPALETYDDVLHESIHPDRLIFDAAANALRAYRDRTRLKHLDASIDNLERKAGRAKEMNPLPVLPPRQAKIGIFGKRTMDHGLFDSVNRW